MALAKFRALKTTVSAMVMGGQHWGEIIPLTTSGSRPRTSGASDDVDLGAPVVIHQTDDQAVSCKAKPGCLSPAFSMLRLSSSRRVHRSMSVAAPWSMVSRKSTGSPFLPKFGLGAHTRGWISDAQAPPAARCQCAGRCNSCADASPRRRGLNDGPCAPPEAAKKTPQRRTRMPKAQSTAILTTTKKKVIATAIACIHNPAGRSGANALYQKQRVVRVWATNLSSGSKSESFTMEPARYRRVDANRTSLATRPPIGLLFLALARFLVSMASLRRPCTWSKNARKEAQRPALLPLGPTLLALPRRRGSASPTHQHRRNTSVELILVIIAVTRLHLFRVLRQGRIKCRRLIELVGQF